MKKKNYETVKLTFTTTSVYDVLMASGIGYGDGNDVNWIPSSQLSGESEGL